MFFQMPMPQYFALTALNDFTDRHEQAELFLREME
jgi:hypothetical protein